MALRKPKLCLVLVKRLVTASADPYTPQWSHDCKSGPMRDSSRHQSIVTVSVAKPADLHRPLNRGMDTGLDSKRSEQPCDHQRLHLTVSGGYFNSGLTFILARLSVARQ